MSTKMLTQIWPEWSIEERPLGRGSFGAVYKAVRRDHGVESYAAIKIISIPADSSEVDSLRSEGLEENATKTYFREIVNDFVKEIKVLESLKGVPNIVSVEDYKVVEKADEIGWNIYIRMELLTPLNTHICDKKLSEEDVIKLGCDICSALEICSKRNIMHRDIKPENILVNDDFGYYKLGDFGIARRMENITSGLSQKGTINYMAPEVANGSDEYDSRVDIYSLGLVLYRLMNANRLPFLDSEKQLLNPNERKKAVDRRLNGEVLPLPCDASPAMADVILRACAYDPNKRFTTPTDMKNALLSVANGTYNDIGDAEDMEDPIHQTPRRKVPVKAVPVRTTTHEQAEPAKVVSTFGKKKPKIPAIIATALAAALLILGGAFAIPKLARNFAERKQIAAIIEDAAADAESEDFEGALKDIQTGLNIYPESDILLAKEIEYADALTLQIKERTLDEASGLAASGNYISAMSILENAQAVYGDDAAYTQAFYSYRSQYKADALNVADDMAGNGDFEGAIKTINDAIDAIGEEQLLTQKIQEYQLDNYISKAEAYAEASNYAEALAMLDTAEQLNGKNSKITATRQKIEKMEILYNLDQYENAKDYAGAITYYNELRAYREDSDIVGRVNVYKREYQTSVLNAAEEAFDSSGYEPAIALLNDGLKVLPQDEQINEVLEKYKTYIPISIAKLEYFTGSDFALGNNKKDNLGNIHDNVVLPPCDGWSNAYNINVYKLRKQYSKLTGLWFQFYECRTSNMPYSSYEGKLDIYGDGTLLYSGKMGPGIEPIDLNIDISGVDELKISYFGGGSIGSSSGIENFCVQK